MDELQELYNDLIMEHSMNSENKKELQNSTCSEMGHNPNCGDEIKLQLKLKVLILPKSKYNIVIKNL